LIKAILFDNDGVLINSMPYHFRAWKTVFEEYNICIESEDVLLTEGCKSIELAQKIFADKEINLSDEELTRFVKRKNLLYQSITEATLRPGTESFLKAVERRSSIDRTCNRNQQGQCRQGYSSGCLSAF